MDNKELVNCINQFLDQPFPDLNLCAYPDCKKESERYFTGFHRFYCKEHSDIISNRKVDKNEWTEYLEWCEEND